MRLCNRCRELGRICAACAVVLFVSGHDPHTQEDQKQGPEREVRPVTVASSTSSNMAATDWIVVPERRGGSAFRHRRREAGPLRTRQIEFVQNAYQVAK
jgi:hypothetical protein